MNRVNARSEIPTRKIQTQIVLKSKKGSNINLPSIENKRESITPKNPLMNRTDQFTFISQDKKQMKKSSRLPKIESRGSNNSVRRIKKDNNIVKQVERNNYEQSQYDDCSSTIKTQLHNQQCQSIHQQLQQKTHNNSSIIPQPKQSKQNSQHHIQSHIDTNQHQHKQSQQQSNFNIQLAFYNNLNESISSLNNEIDKMQYNYWQMKEQIQTTEYDINQNTIQLQQEKRGDGYISLSLIGAMTKTLMRLNSKLNYKQQLLKTIETQLNWNKQVLKTQIQQRNIVWKFITDYRNQFINHHKC